LAKSVRDLGGGQVPLGLEEVLGCPNTPKKGLQGRGESREVNEPRRRHQELKPDVLRSLHIYVLPELRVQSKEQVFPIGGRSPQHDRPYLF
jgi:hypothetical protein